MKTPQNVLRMSTVSPYASRLTVTPLTGAWLQQQSNGPVFCIRLIVSFSVLQGNIKIKRLR